MPVLAPFEQIAMDKGKKEGIKEGKQEGIQIGSLKEAQATIIDILSDEFGKLPASLTQSIKSIDDLSYLRKLRKQALRIESLEAFDQLIKEYHNHQSTDEN